MEPNDIARVAPASRSGERAAAARPIDWREHVWYGGLAVFVAACCTVVWLHALGDLVDGIPAWHQGFLDNLAYAPSQYRVTGFLVPELLARVGFGIIDAYVGLRFLYLAVALYLGGLVARSMGLGTAPAGLHVALVGVYYASATQAHYQPAEESNLVVFAAFLLVALRSPRFGWFLALIVVGAFTKSTAVFLLPAFALLAWFHRREPARRVVLQTLILTAAFFAVYLGVRWHFGTDRPYLGGQWQIDDNLRAFRGDPYRAWFWLLPSVLPIAVVCLRWHRTDVFVRCFVPSAVLFVVGHLAISKVLEWRTYTPLALVFWPALLPPLLRWIDRDRNHDDAGPHGTALVGVGRDPSRRQVRRDD